jgi:hypothetical protein
VDLSAILTLKNVYLNLIISVLVLRSDKTSFISYLYMMRSMCVMRMYARHRVSPHLQRKKASERELIANLRNCGIVV